MPSSFNCFQRAGRIRSLILSSRALYGTTKTDWATTCVGLPANVSNMLAIALQSYHPCLATCHPPSHHHGCRTGYRSVVPSSSRLPDKEINQRMVDRIDPGCDPEVGGR